MTTRCGSVRPDEITARDRCTWYASPTPTHTEKTIGADLAMVEAGDSCAHFFIAVFFASGAIDPNFTKCTAVDFQRCVVARIGADFYFSAVLTGTTALLDGCKSQRLLVGVGVKVGRVPVRYPRPPTWVAIDAAT